MTNVRKTDDRNQIFIVCLYLTTFFRADGLIYDLDVSLYSDYKKYNWQQMNQIKNGLYKQLDVSAYLDSNFKW